jgi:hypothetical protein
LAQGDLVVLKGVGGDVVGAAEMRQQERNQNATSCCSQDMRQVAEDERRGPVGHLVRHPEDDRPNAGALTSADAGEEGEDDMRAQAHKDHAPDYLVGYQGKESSHWLGQSCSCTYADAYVYPVDTNIQQV